MSDARAREARAGREVRRPRPGAAREMARLGRCTRPPGACGGLARVCVGFELVVPARASMGQMADGRFLYLLDKYRQDMPGHAPWPRINVCSENELEADLHVAAELREQFPTDTYEHNVGGGVIAGWLAQALRMRPYLLQYPTDSF
jgi:hypothetical protein